jgi:peroxiredoxin
MTWRGGLLTIALIALLLATSLLLGGVFGDTVPSVEGGNPAPDFSAVNVMTGEVGGLDDYADKVVLLNVWATWCEPCKAEMPAMERAHQELGALGLEVVAVSVDMEGTEEIIEFVEEYGITFDVLQDRTQEISSTYQIFALPQSYVIDRRGMIVYKEFGPVEWDGDTYRTRFRDLLSQD